MGNGMSYFSQFTNRPSTPNRLAAFSSSGNWVSPSAGWVTIAVVGAGGSGAAGSNNASNDRAGGGGAGGFCVKTFYTPAGATYAITIGAGGAQSTATNNNVNGSSGGITTVNGVLCSLVCNSGAGGVNDNSVITPAVGGNATGGDINYTGGAGGGSNATNNVTGTAALGGGAVNVLGITANGGNSNITNQIGFMASGGGGVGGSGGEIVTANTCSSGGGSGGPGLDGSLTLNQGNLFVVGGAGSPATASGAPFLSFNAPGGYGVSAVARIDAAAVYGSKVDAGVGGGGGGCRQPVSASITGGTSAGFGGGGGQCGPGIGSVWAIGGRSMLGGGGGAATVGTNAAIGGIGGQGAVYIGFYGN
jgi:hypothetical protein